jgi:hypothetical protein
MCNGSKMARCDQLRAVMNALADPTVKNAAGGVVMHPVYAELSRTESRLRECLCGLFLTPRTRGATRLPAESQAGAVGGDDTPEALLRILG